MSFFQKLVWASKTVATEATRRRGMHPAEHLRYIVISAKASIFTYLMCYVYERRYPCTRVRGGERPLSPWAQVFCSSEFDYASFLWFHSLRCTGS